MTTLNGQAAVLSRLAAVVGSGTPYAVQLLKGATFYIDATEASAGDQAVVNLGTGGAALNAQAGSGTGVDTNDPKFLAWSGTNYVYLPGVAGNFLSVPDEAALDTVGDLDLRIRMAMDDWTPAANTRLVVKEVTTSTGFSYQLDITTAGILRLTWAPTGATTFVTSSATTATGVADGATKWVRATLDVDNGASGNDVKFWLSDDGASWTQLGSTVTTAGTTSLHAGTGDLRVGADTSATNLLAGKVYRAQVLDGIGGTTVLDIDTSVITSGSVTTFTATTGQTVTVNRATSGRKTTCVVCPVWLLGTDDYMIVPHDAQLDMADKNALMTVVFVERWFADAATPLFIGKAATDFFTVPMSAGWAVYYPIRSKLSDGTNVVATAGGSITTGPLSVVVTTYDGTNMKNIINNTQQTTVSLATVTGATSNTAQMVIGKRGAGSSYSDNELFAVAIFRRVLTASEIAAITSYFQARVR